VAYLDATTRLGPGGGPRTAYAGFTARDPSGFIPAPPRRGGRTKRRRRYIVEVDGKHIPVNSIAEAESVLQQVRAIAEESAERDVTTTVTPKPPRVSVKTAAGNVTTSVVIQREVKRTQKVINRAYIMAAKGRARDMEISQLMTRKLREEDEEDSLILLLLM